MRTSAFDYHLPPELIAQTAAEPRDSARLMRCPVDGSAPTHHRVSDLDALLRPGDLLVFNRTRVIPARLDGRKPTGGAVEVLLVHPHDADARRWICLVGGKVRPGTRLAIADAVAVVESLHEDGTRLLAFDRDPLGVAEAHGRIPLPPYIRRRADRHDASRYQTVFGDLPGSVAAPTAGLHFTAALLDRLAARGIGRAVVELAIGPGTFKPVDTERIDDFRIHAERGECPAATVDAIRRTRAAGGRVIAVGTTCVRVLETAARQDGGLAPWRGWTRIFLHPPQRLLAVDGLITNFHLPRSSLLMLVACRTGLERLHALYAEAIRERYRFYSYGDAMLII